MNSSYGKPSASSGRTSTITDNALRSTTVGLKLEVNSFKVGKMRIRCVAELYGVFKTSAETVLDEEKPRLASILGTFSSTGNNAENMILMYCTITNDYCVDARWERGTRVFRKNLSAGLGAKWEEVRGQGRRRAVES